MEKTSPSAFVKFLNAFIVAVALLVFYIAWTHTTIISNWIVAFITALLVSLLFVKADKLPAITPKKVIYSVIYIFYLFIEIVKSNFDVAYRVVQPRIPINPGIVKVQTRLKSKVGRMILANSITLTPGTLSVEVKNDHYYIHWIDVTDMDVQGASEKIVAGFEKYLEVIFG
ncbi:Na+/H+ antiporter subunit E [candidate division KSB1 bacterium]|nr:MAG: Na+/H+ antiporter subunit E [candidate division KSB1 bacterium]